MRARPWLIAVFLVTACSENPGDGTASVESMEAVTADAAAPQTASPSQTVPVNVAIPKIAYIYSLGYLLPANAIADIQSSHLALCDQVGPARCQLVGMEREGGEEQYASATMQLRVASSLARTFSDRLDRAVADNGGRAVDTRIEAEDVSKAIVDAEARIRQRELLVSRLTEILRSRTGKVAELVEAERSVTQAQEELDQARGWLAELRQRVSTSTFNLSYRAVAPTAVERGKLGDAVADSASGFLIGLRMILVVLIYLLPWMLIGALGWLAWRTARRFLRERAERE